ncbi:AI-2E family transporter [Porphyrobacter sp. CACIAM 03H1]|uniref:AI-2E family transporter n=1 Tax=Porphyrobacter sp. CACIAM 03H1 TaxID=2003315 RepID=UPI000B5A6AE0|nr:AI-2E family transporter [Porphyrobacter sp. CACIAM 03H1]ASJ90004.1 AI-2E family transporter [Porphyrobacter sp. CACIAM 03H1]
MAAHPHRTEDLQQASFLIILAVVSLLMAVIVYPFAQPLLWAALAAIMFQPLYRTILRRLRGRRNPAAGLSLLVIFILVLVPFGWIATMVIEQAIMLVATLQKQPLDLAAWFDTFYTALPEIARDAVDRSGWADITMIQTRLQEFLTQSAGMIATQAVTIGSEALGFILSFGVALYVMFFLLRDGERIGRTVLCAVPVERSIADRLAERFLGIVRATIKGTGVVALVQGTLGWITLMIAGVPSALLFGVVMAIFALVPVIGSGAVWVPAGIWLLISGATWQGLFVLLTGFFIISSADNVLRPILVGRDTGIPDWIILITTLGGISLVGFSGIVLGPLVAGLFLASWSILREQREEDEEASRQDDIRVDASGHTPDAVTTVG